MKRVLHIFFFLVCFGTMVVKAQYPILHVFNDTLGDDPYGSLIQSKGILYGMANSDVGGECVFSLDTNGNHYKAVHLFHYGYYGGDLRGSLLLVGKTLYGMMYYNPLGNGSIFRVDTSGGNFKDIHDFNSTDGQYPMGSLIIVGHNLYGTTSEGGANGNGVIFSIDTNGTGYRDMYDFNTGGIIPESDLTYTNGKFYGTARTGGTDNNGTVFSIDSNGTNKVDIVNFNLIDGMTADGRVVIIGKKLYGTTYAGGSANYGTFFSVDTNGTGFKSLYQFPNTSLGSHPNGLLTLSGGRIYDMTNSGGGYPYGAIYSIDTSGNYKKLFDFDGINGLSPYGGVTVLNGKVYGMTNEGGPLWYTGTNEGLGVIFCYQAMKIVSMVSTPVTCFGDSTGTVKINVTGGDNSDGGLSGSYTYTWKPIAEYTYVDSISGLPAGEYKVTVNDVNGDTIVDSIYVSQQPLITSSISSLVNSGCKDSSGSAAVIVSGGAKPYQYSWSPSGGTSSAANNLYAGYYTCTVTDSLGCRKHITVNIKDSSSFRAIIVSSANLHCFDDSSGSATGRISGGKMPYTYSWLPYGGSDTIANKLAAGTYTFTTKDSNGCVSDTIITITQPAKLIAKPQYWYPDTGTCSGIVFARVTGGTVPYTYSWSNSNTTDTISNLCTGMYCVTVTDTHGCFDTGCVDVFLDTTMAIKQINNTALTVTVYPNPSNGVFTFQSSVVSNQWSVEVYNMLGEKILVQTLRQAQGDNEIDLSNNASGVYLYRITDKNGVPVASGKLIRN